MPFNTSYAALRAGRYVIVPGAGPYQTLLPRSWGSYVSRLVKVLREGHGDPDIDAQVQLDREAFDRIVTWIDINAPYYPEYASAYGNNRFGRSPLTDAELKKLETLVGSSQVNFTRPELSPCLTQAADVDAAARQQALAIIQLGQQRLAQRPRADMPGFHLVDPKEVRQQAKYDQLQQSEAESRAAIRQGGKHFDAASQ